jgi:uncharacterized membrane protein YgdD (TMEM256/DUF423 family)
MNDPSPAMGFSPITLTAILTAALAGLSGVVLGAYAAHGAPAELREGLSVAALYALIHGLALIAAAFIHDRAAGTRGARWLLRISMLAFALGVALFSGGIFFRTGTAALGGTLLIGGWLGLALGSGALLFTAGKR